MSVLNRKLDTFDIDKRANLLQIDGTAYYYGIVIPLKEANRYFDSLLTNIRWKNDEAIILGKHIITKRKVAWYGDRDYLYTYSNATKQALTWTKELLDLRQIVKQITKARFNSCLINL